MADKEYPVHGEITGVIDQPDPNTPVHGPITGFIVTDLGADLGVTTGTNTPPADPDNGDLWTTIDGKLYIWRGSFWIQVI